MFSCTTLSQGFNRKWSKLVVISKPSEKIVAERDRVLSEKVMRKTVPVLDPSTGDVSLETTETVERIIEREVTTDVSRWRTRGGLGDGAASSRSRASVQTHHSLLLLHGVHQIKVLLTPSCCRQCSATLCHCQCHIPASLAKQCSPSSTVLCPCLTILYIQWQY